MHFPCAGAFFLERGNRRGLKTITCSVRDVLVSIRHIEMAYLRWQEMACIEGLCEVERGRKEKEG